MSARVVPKLSSWRKRQANKYPEIARLGLREEFSAMKVTPLLTRPP